MKRRLLLAALAIGLGTAVFAAEQGDHPRISFVEQTGSHTAIPRDKYVILVVEGVYLSHEKTPLDDAGVVEYVNTLLKAKNISYVAVYTREGVKYGDVVRAIDVLRKTDAKNIGVSLTQLPPGKEP